MKKNLLSMVAGLAVLGVGQLGATTFNDSIGDVFTGAGGGILDITSVEVTHNATDLNFKINLAGDPGATDWGKYLIGIDSVPGGDPAGNGWGRPITMSSGMDYWIGSWVDSGNGVQAFGFSGSWSTLAASGPFAGPGGTPASFPGLSITKDSSSVTITTPLSLFGLAPGSSFSFDVYASGGGGGDSAVDALANPNQSISDWPGPYNSGGLVDLYVVPEPATFALVGLGGLMLLQRFARRRA